MSEIQSLEETLNVKKKSIDNELVVNQINDLGERALDYLQNERGLSLETIKHFNLGYSKERDAISIPLYKRGVLIAIKYRFIEDSEERYDYEKGGQNWIYNEDGIDYARKSGGVVMVEGEFDCMSVWQAGIKNVVSPASGKDSYGVWIEQLDTIPKIIIAYDNDEGGKSTAIKMSERLGTAKCFEVTYPDNVVDANDYFKKYNIENFRDLAKNATPFYKYEFKGISDIIDSLRKKQDETIILDCVPGVKFEKDCLAVVSGVTNVGKCHGKGTEILMYNGSVKKVEDIIVGDKVMGKDSTPRNVLSLASGTDEMFRVTERGDYYDCNSSHVLSLQKYDRNGGTKEKQITISDFNLITEHKKRFLRGWKTGVSFVEKEVSIPSYILGLWLGDGTSSKTQVTTQDKAIVDEINKYAKDNDLSVTKRETGSNAYTYDIVNRTRKEGSNSMLNGLRKLNVINNKHIPQSYKINSEINRLELLAGLIDTDGYLCKTIRGECYEIIQKNKQLSNDIVFLARSLGFRATVNKSIKRIKSTGFVGEYCRIFIVGDLGRIPVRISYKKSTFVPKKNYLTSKIKVEPLGVGDYYGFTLDGDNLYLLSSFTVTHNSSYVMNMADELTRRGVPTLFLPFERGIEALGKRFLQVKFDKTMEEFSNLDTKSWEDIIKECVETPIYFALPKRGEIIPTIIKSKRLFDTRVVIVDHLDYMIRNVSGNKEAEIANTLQALKRVAEENKIIMIIVTHIRKVDQGRGMLKRDPTMEDLKGSSSLSQDPEVVIMLTKPDDGVMRVAVLKNKGEMETKDYIFNFRSGKLGDGEWDLPEVKLPKLYAEGKEINYGTKIEGHERDGAKF